MRFLVEKRVMKPTEPFLPTCVCVASVILAHKWALMFMRRVALWFGGRLRWRCGARGAALCAVGLVVGSGDCGSGDDFHCSVVQAGAHWPILDT